MKKALGDLRVLDLTRALAGPYCTLMLGDYGADIVKIEVPGSGDDTRGWGPPYIGDQAAYFLQANRNKRSMTLNLKDPQGKQIFLGLAKDADVIVENYTPGVVKRLGIDYDVVQKLNPRIVYCSISGYGQTGPYREKPAYDQVMQGLGGIMSLTGEVNGPPMKMGVALTDIGAGMNAAFAIMAALHYREQSNRGQYIDISMLDLQVSWLTYQAGAYFATGLPPKKSGASHPNLVPYQYFICKDDKYINIAVGSERLWRRFCAAMDMEGLAESTEYANNVQRVINRDSLVGLLQQKFLKKTVDEWVQLIESAGVPCGAVNDVADVLNDTQVKARDMVLEIPHPTLGTIQQTGVSVKFSLTKGGIDRHPPLLGEHTDAILGELGFNRKQIEDLRTLEVV
jgi:formyl-CoA transferase